MSKVIDKAPGDSWLGHSRIEKLAVELRHYLSDVAVQRKLVAPYLCSLTSGHETVLSRKANSMTVLKKNDLMGRDSCLLLWLVQGPAVWHPSFDCEYPCLEINDFSAVPPGGSSYVLLESEKQSQAEGRN